MSALVEVHSAQEMRRVLGGVRGLQLVGINNRDLETFNVDFGTTQRILSEPDIAEMIRERDILVVGESGIESAAHVDALIEAGCDAVLVGESLVKKTTGDWEQATKTILGIDQ